MKKKILSISLTLSLMLLCSCGNFSAGTTKEFVSTDTLSTTDTTKEFISTDTLSTTVSAVATTSDVITTTGMTQEPLKEIIISHSNIKYSENIAGTEGTQTTNEIIEIYSYKPSPYANEGYISNAYKLGTSAKTLTDRLAKLTLTEKTEKGTSNSSFQNYDYAAFPIEYETYWIKYGEFFYRITPQNNIVRAKTPFGDGNIMEADDALLTEILAIINYAPRNYYISEFDKETDTLHINHIYKADDSGISIKITELVQTKNLNKNGTGYNVFYSITAQVISETDRQIDITLIPPESDNVQPRIIKSLDLKSGAAQSVTFHYDAYTKGVYIEAGNNLIYVTLF